MKKHLIIIGMVFLLIFVGLSGCMDNPNDEPNGDELDDDTDDDDTDDDDTDDDTQDDEESDDESTSPYVKIGDSLIIDGVNYTFLRAYWAERFSSHIKIYTVDIIAENIGTISISKYITATQYEMENGNKIEPPITSDITAHFALSPGESIMDSILCSEDYFDMDSLPIAFVYLTIDSSVNIMLNVL